MTNLAYWSAGISVIAATAHAVAAQPSIAAQPFDCLIEARQTIKLSSSAMGVVMELYVDRGDVVHKGQLLGKLDDRIEAANLALAKARATSEFETMSHQARLEWLRVKFSRANELSATRLVSRNTRDEAESDMRVEEQQLRLAQHQHALAQLEARQAEVAVAQRSFISPVNGVVIERLLGVGEYRNDQSAILTLAEIDPLRVEAFVPTLFFGQISVGAVAEVRPEQPVGGVYRASVAIVDKVIDAASGTFGVRLDLSNAKFNLPAGLKCKVQFLPFSSHSN